MIYYKRKSWIKKILLNLKRKDYSFLNFFKVTFFVFAVLIFALYFGYLILLPKFVTEDRVENYINSYLSKNTKLEADFSNLKVNPNYKFDINIKADLIKLKYAKNRDFISLNGVNIDVNILTLFLGYIDLNKIKAKKITINTNFTLSKKYECFNYFDLDIFDLKAHNSKFELRNIRIFANEFNFNLYDENIKKKFYINSNDFKFFLSEIGKPVIISSKGFIKSSNHLISKFCVDLEFISAENTLKIIKNYISHLNYNPLRYADEYKFYSDTLIKLKISNYSNKKTDILGNISLKNYTFNIKDIALPKNNVVVQFKGDKIFADCNFNLIKNQFIKLGLFANINKNGFIELKVDSSSINLSELHQIIYTALKIFIPGIKTDELSIKGSASANLYIKSDFKNIISKGKININNAEISNPKQKLSIYSINSNIDLENNKINILNSSGYFDKSKFYITGNIDSNTNLSLKLNSDLINLAEFINFVKQIPLVSAFNFYFDDYVFKKGYLKVNVDIGGNFKNPKINIHSFVNNLSIFLKPYKSSFDANEVRINSIKNKDILINILNGKITNNDFNISIPDLKVNVLDDKISILKSSASVNKINAFIDGNIDIENQIVKLNIEANNFIDNNLLVIKNRNAALKANIELVKNKINIISAKIFDDENKLISIGGFIDDFKYFNNIKIDVENKISLVLPKFDNLSVNVDCGNLLVNGDTETAKIDGKLELSNFSYKTLGLYIKSLAVDINNSIASVKIKNAKMLDFDFDLISQLKYVENKIVVDNLNFSSSYINLNTIQKYLKQKNLFSDLGIIINNYDCLILSLEFDDIIVNSIKANGKLIDNILYVDDFNIEIFGGTAAGKLSLNLKNNMVVSNIILKEINMRHLASKIKNYTLAVSGKLNAVANLKFNILDNSNFIKTLSGDIDFNIHDGELAQFAKLERFLQAGNILSQSILKLTLNSTLSAVTKQNTGDFKTIEGVLNIKDSIAEFPYIKTSGSNMSLYITGKYKLENNTITTRVLGRIPHNIVNIMGGLGQFSTSQLVEKMSSGAKDVIKSITVSPLEKMLSTTISKSEIEKIPDLAFANSFVNTREFIVIIAGPVDSISSIKYFKWIIKN